MTRKKPAGTPGMAEHTCNFSTEAGGFLVGSLPILQSEFKASLSYTMVCLKKHFPPKEKKERNGMWRKREEGIKSSDNSEGETSPCPSPATSCITVGLGPSTVEFTSQ